MVVYNSNATEIVSLVVQKVKSLSGKGNPNTDKMLRTIASTITAKMVERVHEKGIAADGSKIGVYSEAYMKVRTGIGYRNADKISRGKNKGNDKNAGYVTKYGVKIAAGKSFFVNIENQKIPRKSYNRTSDTTVILSLSNQMQNDLTICEQNPIETTNGYAIGYQNILNYDKAIWNETRYKKKILTELSREEQILSTQIAEKYTTDVLD